MHVFMNSTNTQQFFCSFYQHHGGTGVMLTERGNKGGKEGRKEGVNSSLG